MFSYENAQTAPQTRDKHAQRMDSRRNDTGLPDKLKEGIENLSGYSMDNVRVHYNSSKPARLSAYAYTQGTEIHVAPGQEKHLPHEAWHVVQQMQGLVKPMYKMHGVNINDDPALEHAASVFGAKANGFSGVTQLKKTEIDRSCIQCEFNKRQLGRVLAHPDCNEIKQMINSPAPPSYQQLVEKVRELINKVYPNENRDSESNIDQVIEELGFAIPEKEIQERYSYDENKFIKPIPDECSKAQLNNIYNQFESERFINPNVIYHIDGHINNNIGKTFWRYVRKGTSMGKNPKEINKDDYLIDILGVYTHAGSNNHQNEYQKDSRGGSGPEKLKL